jgi:hypothetical protein
MPFQVQSQQLKWSTGSVSATTNVSSEVVRPYGGRISVQVVIAGTGTVSVTATIQVSNNGTNWIDANALTLSGTTTDTDGATIDAAWAFMRVTLTSITGTGATATAFIAGNAA